MIANVFWCGKVHSVTFGQGKEGLTTLGNAIKEFSKIPVSDQVILYHGVAMPTLKASFDTNEGDAVSFIVYDRKSAKEKLPSNRLEETSALYSSVLNGDNENVDSKDSEDVRMVEFEEKNPIVYTKESGSSFDIINSTCTAAIIYHPYKQRCFKYDDKLICTWCAEHCRHNKVRKPIGFNTGPFKCQCSEITHEKCYASSMILTQERPRTPFTVSIELLGECSTQNPNIFIPLNANISKYNNISAIIKNNSTDEVAQACALSLLPEDLAQRYPLTTMAGRDVSTYSDSDATVYGLLQWFKNEFFEFRDNPTCPVCGGRMFTNGPVLMLSGNERVSYVFKCPKCIPISQNVCTGNFTPMGVLDARGGRLDEAVELFALFLQSLMLDVRIVVTDTWYKWVEVYSEVQRRWIHCDPTLGLFDSPLTYEKTWGDKASNPYCFKFCIAVGPDCELVDVSRRYTQDYSGLVRARAESGITERNRLVVLRMREFVNGLKLNEPNLDTLRKVIERQNEEIRQLTSGNNKTLYGEAIDPQQNRYLRPRCDNSVHVLGEWLEAQSIEKPLFSHTDFSRAHDVWTAGSAIKIPQRKAPLVLTTNNTNKVGAAWVVVDKAKVLEKGFFTSFDFTILYPGADGFAFVVQGLGPGVFGNGGCQIGYGGLHHSVAVEFDNYLSQSECNDPSPLHVGVNTMYESPNTADHGRAGLGATSAVPQFANGAVHSVGIAFRNRTVLVWMDSVLILTVTDCNLDRVLKGRDGCWVGFTAATGGLSQQHNIESWSLSYFN